MSEITRAHWVFGAERHLTRSAEIRELIDQLLMRLEVLPWHAAEMYARVRTQLERSGVMIGNMDMLIGAHALEVCATLFTNNRRRFERIEGLSIETWVDV